MVTDDFFEEIRVLSKQTPYLSQVSEKIKSHDLPVVIFGASNYARIVAKKLTSVGVKIAGFAVDEKYFVPNKKFFDLPIYNFDEICKSSDKYVFVLGIGSKVDGGERCKDFMGNVSGHRYVSGLIKIADITCDYIFANKTKFVETFDLLSDDFSKKSFKNYLMAQVTDDPQYLEDITVDNEYFNSFTNSAIGGSYVDCGAFIGDSVEGFINFANGNYKKIFAIEADPKNFAEMENFIREKNYKNVEIINCGVWDEIGSITFKSAECGSKIVDNGDITVPTDTIDNIVGDENINFIKMDIEGAELNALKGAVKTLRRCKPVLALSAYHKKEDLITLPQFIKQVYGDCRFYLRKHEGLNELYGLDLYIVPD